MEVTSLVILFILAVLALCVLTTDGTTSENTEHILRQSLRLRQNTLRRFARMKGVRAPCSTTQYIVITEYPFGQTGNKMISFTHGVWFAEQLNATLVVPGYMHEIFAPFNTSFAHELYCFTLSEPPKSAKILEITSEEMFFGFKVYELEAYKPLLQPFTTNQTVPLLSLHFLQLYASLWCCPHRKLLHGAEMLIQTVLDGNFHYSSVHKRQLDGGCSKIMGHNTKPSDFSQKELPMNRPEWNGNLVRSHPLCDMSFEFVQDTLSMHLRNNSKLFVAHDGRGSVEDFKQHGAYFSFHLDNPELKANLDTKYLDMFTCIHSDFFVLNPRSTFSLQIFFVRSILSLPSVPIIRNNDIFLQKIPDETKGRELWVSMSSVLNALQGAR